MDTAASRALVLAISILVSVAVGVLIGSALARQESRVAGVETVRLPDDGVASALRFLTEELERVRTDRGGLSELPVSESRSQLGAAVDDHVLAELNEAMHRLAQAVDAMRVLGSGPSGGSGALVVPRTASARAELETFTAAGVREQAKPYLLNSYQQVMDRFGMPSDVAFNESAVTWIYQRSGGGSVYFTFAGGLLARTRCEDP